MNRRELLIGTAATVAATTVPAAYEHVQVGLRYDVYEPATRRLLYSFRQTKEIIAANILNQMPTTQWREGGWFEPDRDPNV
jgi:hypothetical protein